MSAADLLNDAEEGLWDANDVAKFFKASRNWVYDQTSAGKLPHVKLGGLLRFHPDAIRAVAKGEEVPGARVVAFDPARRKG